MEGSGRPPAEAGVEQFWLNGQPRPWRPGLRVGDLLEELGASGPGVAVERNAEVVRRNLAAGTAVEAGDRIEIVRLVGGG